MKANRLASCLLGLMALLFVVPAKAQTVNVPFSTNAAGKSLPINWGMDTAWDDEYNVKWGIAHYGANFTTGRISFQPYALVDATKIDDASANFGLPDSMAVKLQARIDKIKWTGTTKVAINCDHEVLTRTLDKYGNYGSAENNFGKGNYVTNNVQTNATRWYNLIKASVKYAQAQGMEVVSISPFNEPDYGWNQFISATAGDVSNSNTNNYGIPTFKAIAQKIKADSFFDGIRVCGPNTLNDDKAATWYNGLKDVLDEGNTHQLAGSFDNYATFFKTISDAGKVATADELHNVGEAMVGVEYGMTNGIWWAFDAKARGQFMHDSNEGVRLGYAEDRSHWTSAAVYRNNQDGEIHGFIGSSERQANVSTYNFQCQDREVYFNGYGPQKEWSVTTVGGADKSYQNGQINYEYLFDITYGEDVQSAPVDGNYQIMSAADMKLVTSNGAWNGGNHLSATTQVNNNTQRWHIYPDNRANTIRKGDCSYWFIDNVGNADLHWNLLDGGKADNLSAGARVICYNAGHDALEQWYLRYAKDGYFYIMARQSNKYLYNNNGTLSLQDAPTKTTGAKELKKYMWRLMPTDATAEQTAPATPTELAEGTVNATSVSFSWTAVTGESKAVTYNVLRQDANGWNTIARLQSGTTYTDTKVEAGKGYRYKVQAVDYSGNRSEMSEVITIIVPGSENTSDYTAGQWQWTGETVAAGTWYLRNVETSSFFTSTNGISQTTSDISKARFVTITSGSSSSFKFSEATTNYYMYHNNGTNQASISEPSFKFSIAKQGTGYYIYTNKREGTYTRNRHLKADGADNNCSFPRDSYSNDTWLFISPSQMTKYGKMSTYTTAFNAAAGYLSQNISSDLKTGLESTLDACDGTINKDTDIDNYISQLNSIAEECQTYLDNNPVSGPEDFTGLIINPKIIQNGTTNDAPTGWIGATTNVTGNGHWTEGTGDTRLEAWNWSTNANGLNVDYYQDIIVPNGLYTLTADTHQRANGDAALYGETYRSFDATMPIGDGNEAETSVQSILVTDGSLRIGIKATNEYKDVDNQWITADNFTLTRVSTPENTALSHYTNAIAYLDELANEELLRYVDHEELAAARTAAHNCEANASAYEKAINKYVAALKRAQAMEEQEDPTIAVGADMTGYIINPTIQQNGGTNDAPNGWTAGVNVTGNGHWTEGTGDTRLEAWHWAADLNVDYYQIIDDLPNGEYKLTAVTHQRENGNACLYAKAGANEYSTKMPIGDGNEAVTIVNSIIVTDGTLQIGMKASGAGNWVTADNFTLTYLGLKHNATLSCNAGKYGTFVAPYDVTLPKGITAYRVGSVDGTTVNLAVEADGGETLNANTPVIIKNNTKAKITQNYTGTVSSVKDVVAGWLTGFLESGRIIPYDAYVLQTQNDKQAFYKVASTFHGTQNRCYLNKNAANGDAEVKMFNFVIDGEETAVEKIEDGKMKMEDGKLKIENCIFDLNGRRINNVDGLKKGIYIKNGKKYILR